MMTPTTQMILTLKCLFDMAKGIDQKFVHYGICKDDLAMIESICDQEGIDFEWMSDDILL